MRYPGGRPWVHVAFCLTARTDARRSETLRSRVDALGFEAGTITIREKKRDRSREKTFCTEPLAPAVAKFLQGWLDGGHPDGPYIMCGRDGGRFLASCWPRRSVLPSRSPLGKSCKPIMC
jgi:hypothetical protein